MLLDARNSWAISRNTIFEKWKLSKASWMGGKQILTLCFCCRGMVWNNRHFTPSPSIKVLKSDCSSQNWWQIYFELIPIYNYLTFKEQRRFPKPFQECVPGGLPGARSWRSSRNALLGYLQEQDFCKMKNCLKPHEWTRIQFWH